MLAIQVMRTMARIVRWRRRWRRHIAGTGAIRAPWRLHVVGKCTVRRHVAAMIGTEHGARCVVGVRERLLVLHFPRVVISAKRIAVISARWRARARARRRVMRRMHARVLVLVGAHPVARPVNAGRCAHGPQNEALTAQIGIESHHQLLGAAFGMVGMVLMFAK
jgi:hypothetical protein